MVRRCTTHYSAMRAYSRKNGWKLASPAGDRNEGIVMGSLVEICGKVFRDPEDDCLDTGCDVDASPTPGLDILDSSSVNDMQQTNKISQ